MNFALLSVTDAGGSAAIFTATCIFFLTFEEPVDVRVFVTILAEPGENILEAIVNTGRTDAVRPIDPLDA